MREIKEGDIIILGAKGNSYKYAWGYAIKPRFSKKDLEKVKLNCTDMINTRHDNFKYRSDNYNGYIEFEDCECFYENLEDGEGGWGQRIDVDMWHDYNEDSIEYAHKHSFAQGTIHEIGKEDALNIVRKLKNDPNFEFEDKSMENYIELLKTNKNIILTGAPGTGKTYSSSEIAVKLIDENVPSDRAELMKRYKELVNKEQIFFTTFHQSMDYEEFVEGIKPKTINGNITYELEDGIFKKACKSAENNKVVLIIDEINRGNISKIFGELITLLEVDKRKGKENEIEVILPYSKEKFSVPDNLYIIGTMNTADRSIGYIDYALRRRFAFISIKAYKSAIENYYDNINKNSDCKDKAINLFDKIEKLIKENINEEFEANDIMIGHSYFMAQNFEELQNKLEYEIKPLLLEYFKDGILKSNKYLKDKETINNLNYE
ncbi:AAA family ATPase [Brachyspira aalborgi]|uniref:AAA family ATPase n=2 Tax=Brachyspira aalborgi TaxID=29522 RepID=A0A5C8GG08_9SPIR|nr:AAA family ATPase [Brachyspira aalborgi]